MSFNVDFFDGKSSKRYKALISPSYLDWKISYTDDFENCINISWEIQHIKKSNVYTKDWVTFTYGNSFPFQKIESNDTNFINYIDTSNHKSLSNKMTVLLHRSAKKSLSFLLLALVGIGVGMYFYIIPTIASGFAASLNKKSVIEFGDYVFRVLSTDLNIDDVKSKKLQDFANSMEINSTFPLEMYVVDSDILNAFALSGGKIIISSSLLEKIETEEQLAALISHEVSHIENRHVLKNITRNLSGAIFISVLFGDINGVTTILIDNAHLFSQLSYSRDLEKEADIFGLEVMRKNNLNLNGMPQLFQILKDESSINLPAYLNNHPLLEDRIEYTKKIANKQENTFDNNNNNTLKIKWELLKATF